MEGLGGGWWGSRWGSKNRPSQLYRPVNKALLLLLSKVEASNTEKSWGKHGGSARWPLPLDGGAWT